MKFLAVFGGRVAEFDRVQQLLLKLFDAQGRIDVVDMDFVGLRLDSWLLQGLNVHGRTYQALLIYRISTLFLLFTCTHTLGLFYAL